MTVSNPNATATSALPICIAGEWRLGTGERYVTRYPAIGEVVAELNAASVTGVEEIMMGAYRAFLPSGWAQRKPRERAAVLYRVAELIRSCSEALVQRQRLGNDKPINETHALVASAAATFQFFGAVCETLEESLTPTRSDCLTMSVHGPMSMVAAITSRNSPIISEARRMAPAPATGNVVVVKPAEVTPLMALELAAICEEAGVPKGMISVLLGKGSVIGDTIAKHPLVRHVSFTGGTNTGRHVVYIAADKMIPVSLEFGGKSPTMVSESVDFGHAANGVLYGIFSSSGESCIAGSRLFVARSLYEPFMDRLTAAAARLRIGNPADESTQMGPLITNRHRETVESYVAMGMGEGGHLRTSGLRPAIVGCESDYFYTPTIIEGLTNNARICQEEIFGPALVTMPFSDEDELIEQADDSVYVLAAGIWTRDYRRAWRIGRAMQADNVWINTYKQSSISTPFGGWRDSGFGHEKGRLSILQYMEQKSLYWGLNEQPLAWANVN